MPLVAVDGCTITDAAHQGTCTILSGLSTATKIDGKAVCLDGLKVQVAGGSVPGAQIEPVTVTLNARMIQGVKFEGKAPLALGEVSGGSETADYQVGQTVVNMPVVLTITDAGQSDVQGI